MNNIPKIRSFKWFTMHAIGCFVTLVTVGHAAPSVVVQTVTYNNETITLRMDLQNLRGANFELKSQNATGGYDVVAAVDERSYIGSVDGYPGAVSCGILQDDGVFRGAVYFDRGAQWFTLGTGVVETRALDYGSYTNFQIPSSSSVLPGQSGTTTYGYELGMDADYDFYTTSGSDVAKSFEQIEYSVCAMRALYMRDVLLRPYLGRVIVRSTLAHDPYTGLTQGTYLDKVRTEWENNLTDTNPDLVSGVSPSKIGGGLAWVGVVGSGSGYGVSQSGGTGAFDVVARHELGHNWGCSHFVGGSPEGTGIMGGNQPARFSGPEVHNILSHRDSRLTMGGILDDEGVYTAVELPPYASLDSAVFVQTVDSSITVNVLANDHDANGQSISLVGFDSSSAQGGTVTQQGQNLVYTAAGAYVGTDYFHYVVEDSTGRTATGVAVIDVKLDRTFAAYLPLDETSGTTVANPASPSDSGVVQNGGVVGIAGKFGNAVTLDGVDDRVELYGLDLNSDTVTLAAWIKRDSVDQASFASLIFNDAGLNFGSNNELRYHWDSPNVTAWAWDSGLIPPANQWVFVALVIDPTKATIYMHDGNTLQSAERIGIHTPEAFSGTTGIGSNPARSDRNFRGDIDDVRIYKSALTQAQILDLVAGGSSATPLPFDGASGVSDSVASWAPGAAATSYQVYLGASETAVANANTGSSEYQGATTDANWALDLQGNTSYFWRVDTVSATGTVAGEVWSFSTGTTVYEAGLVGHWKFNEGSGTTVADASANSNSGALNGPSWDTGYLAGAVNFDGVDDSVTLGNGPALGGQTDFTVSAWIKTSGTAEQVIVQQRAGGFNGQYQFKMDASGALRFYLYGNSAEQFNFNTTATVNDGQWHYVVAVRDGANGYIYIDGNPVAAATATGTLRDLDSNIEVGIGRDIRDNNKPFNGSIDEVKIYNVAKTGSNLADSYNDYQAGLNDAPVASDATYGIAENSNSGAAVGTVSATDVNSGDVLAYAITAGNVGGAFAIDSNTGAITTTQVLDFEAVSQYVLTVSVSDNATPALSDTATITVNITNVNEAPTANNASGSLAESATSGSAVATVSSIDVDASDSITYAITSGNTGSVFAINSSTGAITTAGALDFETTSSYSLTVTATDGGGLTDTAVVTVAVTNVNEAPIANDASGSLAESATSGSAVATVSSSDQDAGDSVTYAITSGNAGSLFAINSGTGVITTAGSLDYETTSDYSLTVTATDAGGLTDTAVVTVAVTNVNEAPVADNASGSLAESATSGSAVATVSSSDVDAGDSVTYAITAGNTGSAFTINSSTGEITTASALNHEVEGSYALTVTATDAGGLSDSASIDVTVTDADESGLSGVQAWEDAVHNGSSFSHKRTATLAGNATVTVDLSTISGDATYEFIVDAEELAQAETRLLDGNGWGIRFEQWSNSSQLGLTRYGVADYTLAAEAGQSVASPYGAVHHLVYVIDSVNTVTRIYVDSVLVGTVAQAPDFTDSSAVLGFATLRDDANPGVQAFAAYNSALDATEILAHQQAWFGNQSPVADDATFAIAENTSSGAAVGSVIATDLGDTVTYAITAGNSGGEFAIDTNSGAITSTSLFDHETTSQYVLTVTVTDSGSLTDDAVITVNVTNVNEAPIATNTSGSVAEDAAIGSAVATVGSSDPDAGDSVSYAITAGNTAGAFVINSSTGAITTATALDYETTTSYSLTVTATDGGSLTDTATVSVTITDVAEVTAPVVATGAASNLAQTSADVAYTVSDDGGEAPTITVYYGESNGGTTAGNWSSSSSQGVKATGAQSATLSGLTEGTSYHFTVLASNSAGSTWGSSGSFTTAADNTPKLVRSTISAVSSSSWTSVDLGKNYNSAVVVATPIYPNSTVVPVVTRIRNVSGSGFEMKIDRLDGLTDAVSVDVSVIAVEEGIYTQANDGVTMEAVKYSSTITSENNSWVAETRTYQNVYTTPVVVGQVMSSNDAKPSSFWCQGSSRTSPPSSSALSVGKHVGEDSIVTRVDETIGYIVIESGNGSINGVNYTAGLGSDIVKGVGNRTTGYSYSLTGLSSASAAAVSLAGMDGGDGGWAVLFGTSPLTSTQLTIAVDEDQLGNSERSHTSEQVSYIVFE